MTVMSTTGPTALPSAFTAGTWIDTIEGKVRVENLDLGDRLLTRDSGYLPVRWICRCTLGARDLVGNPALQPIRIGKSSLAPGVPMRDLVVSPQHRVLIAGSGSAAVWGERDVLAAARHLTVLPGIWRETADRVPYITLLLDAHEIIRAEGAWAETYQPEAATLDRLSDRSREDLFAVFPTLATEAGIAAFPSARISVEPDDLRAALAPRSAA